MPLDKHFADCFVQKSTRQRTGAFPQYRAKFTIVCTLDSVHKYNKNEVMLTSSYFIKQHSKNNSVGMIK